jgi:drug/metabolite transporter (DMT)-like permease
VYHWRAALIIGATFAVVGVVYLLLQGDGDSRDRTGATLLIVLGAAMAFGFGIIFKGARDL